MRGGGTLCTRLQLPRSLQATISPLYRGNSSVLKRSLVFLAPFLVITGSLAAFHQVQTGFWLPTSGVSRIVMSNMASSTLQLGSLFVSPKFAIRLIQYFPITISQSRSSGWLGSGFWCAIGMHSGPGELTWGFWPLHSWPFSFFTARSWAQSISPVTLFL